MSEFRQLLLFQTLSTDECDHPQSADIFLQRWSQHDLMVNHGWGASVPPYAITPLGVFVSCYLQNSTLSSRDVELVGQKAMDVWMGEMCTPSCNQSMMSWLVYLHVSYRICLKQSGNGAGHQDCFCPIHWVIRKWPGSETFVIARTSHRETLRGLRKPWKTWFGLRYDLRDHQGCETTHYTWSKEGISRRFKWNKCHGRQQ